ncbi:MAG: BACON domain-containing carbohydrate-binding protein, partial [Bacteroidota bacterium]
TGEDGSVQTVTVTQAGAGVIFTVSPTDLDYDAAGGVQEVTVTANISFTASTDAAWLTITETAGGFSVTATENTSTTARTATVTVTGEDGSVQTVTVTQAGAGAVLSVSPDNLQYEFEGGTQSVAVSSNIEWTVTTSEDWLSVEVSEGMGNAEFAVTATPNMAAGTREGTVTVTGGGITATVQVTQAGAGAMLTVSPQSLQLGAEEGCTELNIQSNVSWTVSTASEWITSIDPAMGTGNGVVTVCYAANTATEERTATIDVVSEEAGTLTVQATQAGEALFLSVNPQTLEVPATAGTATFDIASNANWTIASDAGWFAVGQTDGAGNATIELSYDENTSIEGRQASITVSIEGQEVEVVVTQAGAEAFATVDQTAFDVTFDEGCVELNVSSNTSWTLSADADWVTSIEPAAGTGDATVTVCYDENRAMDSRAAQLTLTAGDVAPTTITITQEGNPLSIEDVNGNLIEISTYPSPATDVVNWSFSQPVADDIRLEIMNINGQLIQVEQKAVVRGTDAYQLDVRNYAAGTYLYRFISENGAASGRFIIKE